jgi:hypothetical protein
MNFKTKIAYTAVLATLGMAAGSAQAAYLSEDGTGQVLIYPYYTVQNGFDTYVSVVNTTSSAKAVKVRFIEGKASWEVLDFNLYLSPFDVWAGAVTATTDGAKLVVTDTSCTAPMIPGSVDFRNLAYAGKDSYENAMSRVREGYVEIIEMGVPEFVIAKNMTNPLVPITFAASVTHNPATGKPVDCAWVNSQWALNSGAGTANLNVNAPSGGLTGSGTLINVAQGVDYSYDPTAIEDFSNAVTLHSLPGSTSPSLANAKNESLVVSSEGSLRRAIFTQWNNTTGGLADNSARGRNAINAVLMRSNVLNEYITDPAINAGTDWVVTFPTKRLNVGVLAATAPFLKAWGDLVVAPFYTDEVAAGQSVDANWRACEQVEVTIYDREENAKSTGIDFSPSTTPKPTLCKEANIITFKGGNVLGSLNLNRNLPDVFSSGWMDLSLYNATDANTNHVLSGNTEAISTVNTVAANVTYTGLPVVGFAVEKYVNGSVGGLLSNYGGSFAHKYKRTYLVN